MTRKHISWKSSGQSQVGIPCYSKCLSLTVEADVFAAVQSSSAQYGVVPFENSSNGPVDQTLDCLIDRHKEFLDIMVLDETFLDIEHCLLGHASSPTNKQANPDLSFTSSLQRLASPKTGPLPYSSPVHIATDLRHITDIYSHPQAFGQCQRFLSKCTESAELHEVASTSEAASKIANEPSGTDASISSELAAEVYGLDLLAISIQDENDNSTRFLAIQKGDPHARISDWDGEAKCKALLAFSIKHELPGALADALHVFKANQLNLTSINSRPSRIRPWHYTFLVEFEGIGLTNAVQNQINEVIESLAIVTEGHKYLGHWQE